MSTAFEAVCEKFGLVVKHDPATELVAKFMVELAQTGVHDYEPFAGGNAGAIWPRVMAQTQKTPRS